MGAYTNTAIRIDIKCSDGHQFKMKPNDILMGSRCPSCCNHSSDKATQRFLDNLKNKNYILTGVYTGNMNNVEMQCNVGHKFVRRPNDINNGFGCRICAQFKNK